MAKIKKVAKEFKKEVKRLITARKCRIPAEDRTLVALTKLNGSVYVYCGDKKTRRQFIEDAENEYFHYGDGVSLLEREPQPIMALNKDKTVDFIGYVGTMAFRWADHFNSGKDAIPLIKVDYGKYVAGYKDFIYKP